jgi:hypothetical protein
LKSPLLIKKVLDPPKPPFLRGTLIPVPLFLSGVRGDQQVPKITANYFSNNLLGMGNGALVIRQMTNDQ